MDPEIALIVATYNRVKQVIQLLDSLERQTLSRDRWEVIICDDGSSDSTVAELESFRNRSGFNMRFVTQENQGQSVARHLAITCANAPYIAVIDDDMELIPTFLENYLRAFDQQTRRIIIGRVYPRNDWRKYPLYEAMREYNMSQLHGKMAHGQLNPTGTHFMTGNAGFSRSFYNEVGGFDPRLRLNEDSELGYRFERHGAEFVFCDEASAVHHSNIGTYDKWILRQYDYGKYAVYVWEKFDRNINLHPLRNYVNGDSRYRFVFRAVMWSDLLLAISLSFLRFFGESCKFIGAFRLGIFAYRAQQNIEYNHGVLDCWGGSRRLFLKEVQAFSSHPEKPSYPLGRRPTFTP